MEKEEILSSNKKSGKSTKELEDSIAVKSGLVDVLTAIFVVIILILTEYFLRKTFNLGILAVGFSIVSADLLYMGFKNKLIVRIVAGVLTGLFALALVITYVSQLRVA